MASDLKPFSFVNVDFKLGSQLTSCIISQAVIALHFLYVSCRSLRGRGWAYASLRFELDQRGSLLSMLMLPTTADCRKDGRAASAATPISALEQSAPAESQRAGAAGGSVLSQLRARWLGLQQRRVSRCRVFVVPCVAVRDAGGGGGGGRFAVARPVFDMRWLRPLQRLADAHPRFYIGFGLYILGVPCISCAIIFSNQTESRGISTLVLNMLLCIMMLGFLSSKRYGLDRVAARHVALSFRFAVIVALLATDVALTARRVFTIGEHPTVAVSRAFGELLFCLCVLLDCSPHLPPLAQIFLSVRI